MCVKNQPEVSEVKSMEKVGLQVDRKYAQDTDNHNIPFC